VPLVVPRYYEIAVLSAGTADAATKAPGGVYPALAPHMHASYVDADKGTSCGSWPTPFVKTMKFIESGLQTVLNVLSSLCPNVKGHNVDLPMTAPPSSPCGPTGTSADGVRGGPAGLPRTMVDAEPDEGRNSCGRIARLRPFVRWPWPRPDAPRR
jgi:hypothetical protein